MVKFKRKYKYIYGPVPSWRLGSSLGIDPLSTLEKTCTFDCIYCQLGRTNKFTKERKIYVQTREIVKEMNSLPPVKIDYITFSGSGEPTLAENLCEIIKAIRKFRREKISILTNSSLMDREEVRRDLSLADFVIVKLDAYSQESLETINRPIEGTKFDVILKGILQFRKEYKGKFGLQVMFIKENEKNAKKIASFTREILPDEVQINTPLRPCEVSPLSKEEIEKIAGYFKGVRVITVYGVKKKKVIPISREDTIKRRGKTFNFFNI